MVVDIGEVKRHIKPKADSTLRNMRKEDLIEYIRCLENNYNVAVSFNNQQAKNCEKLLAKAAEVVHGHWFWAEDAYIYCSECKQKAPVIPQYQDEPMTSMTNYCPHCGAKMDGERKYNG